MIFTLAELAEVTGGTILSKDPGLTVRSLTIDSRDVPEDCLFVPVRGERLDGHDFIETALNAGAKASLTSEKEAFEYYEDNHEDHEKGFLLVDDTVEALQAIGKAARKKLNLTAVGVTGSVGKTTTREMIARALSAGGKTAVTEKNYNNRLGVPITLTRIAPDDQFAVLELGMNVPGELGLISSLTDLYAAVITNIGVAHMEYYGSKEKIAEEKMTVTRGFWPDTPGEKLLFINGDDPYLIPYKSKEGCRVVTFGMNLASEYYAKGLRCVNANYVFDFCHRGETLTTVTLQALGAHNVLNAVAALAVADCFGVDVSLAAKEVGKFTGFKGRLEKREKNGFLLIDDTYNASPDSMIAGLKVLHEVSFGNGDGRRIAVIGDMLELGDQSEAFHYEVGRTAAALPLTEVYFVGHLAESLRRGLLEGGFTGVLHKVMTRDQVLTALKESVRPGDVVYLKASRLINLSVIAEELMREDA